MDLFTTKRKSHIVPYELYFYTATIHNWYPLLSNSQFKLIILDSLQYLSNRGKLEVFAFVIMPNHIHLIWKVYPNDGKETVQASFLKYTAHAFKKQLIKEEPALLRKFAVNAANKAYQFWQRDSLAIHLYTSKVAYQKLDYIHLNPLAKHWQLAAEPADYFYSSASFYEKDQVNFSFLKDLREMF